MNDEEKLGAISIEIGIVDDRLDRFEKEGIEFLVMSLCCSFLTLNSKQKLKEKMLNKKLTSYVIRDLVIILFILSRVLTK